MAQLTREGDVKTSVSVGVVSQELQPGHVSAGCDGRREDVSREGAQDGRFSLTDDMETKGFKPERLLQFPHKDRCCLLAQIKPVIPTAATICTALGGGSLTELQKFQVRVSLPSLHP